MPQMNKNHCHILFKNTSSFDFFLPKFANSENSLTIILWDKNSKNLKKNLPSKNFLKKINLKIKIYTIYNFLNSNFFFITNLLSILKLEKILFYFFEKLSIINDNKLINFLKKFESISIDGRNFKQVYQKKTLFNCLNLTNKNINVIPHAPHFRTPNSENEFFHDLKKNKLDNFTILISNKHSYKKIKYFNLKFLSPPAISNSWIKFLKKKKLLKKNNYLYKRIGIILRPFRKNFNLKKLKSNQDDYYISSYDENVQILKQCQNLVKKKFKILLRLHPSTNQNEFYKFYKKYLIKNEIILSQNSIHEFLISCDAIISYPSTAIIYAYFYNKKVFLINNNLQKMIEKKWPYLNYLYSSISMKIGIRDIINIRKLLFKKKNFNNKFKNFF